MNALRPLAFVLLCSLSVTLLSDRTPEKLDPQQIQDQKQAPYDHYDRMVSYPALVPDQKGMHQSLHMTHAMSQASSRSVGFDLEWTVEGPANIGARINSIAVPKGKNDTIYIGYAHGGMFRTYNGGSTWEAIFEDEERICIGDIAINPFDDAVMYAGTGDKNINGSFFTGNGIYKSFDYGDTWTHMGLTDQSIISEIIVHPIDTSIVFAATMGIPSLPNSDRGLYKSQDGGNTWTQVLFVNDTTGINDIAIDPNDPDIIYASGWTRYRTNQQSTVSGSGGKIWKSTDGGDNWTQLTNGLPSEDMGRVGITMYEANPDTLYALFVGTNSQLHEIYRTYDGGATWTTVPTTSTGVNGGALGGFGWYFSGIHVNPYDHEDIFFEGIQLWRTSNSGGTWSEADPPWWTYEVHADKHDMYFLGPNSFLLATDGGLYRTDNNAITWSKIESNKTNEFYRVEHSPLDEDNYYGGMQDNGTSGGNYSVGEWPRIYGGDGFQARFSNADEDLFYAETQNGNIVYTDNGGISWSSVGFPHTSNRTNWDTPYILSKHSNNIMYAASHVVWRDAFTPFGSWSTISPDLTDGNIFGSGFHTISGLDESILTPRRLYACTSDGNVWRTEDMGAGWDSIHADLPNRYVTSVKASPSDSQRVFVTHSGYKYNDFFAHVHRSDNNGDTWIDISGDLPPIAINDIIIYPDNNDSILFIATDAGVYGTVDAGTGWQRVGTNMPMIRVLDLEFDLANDLLIAGTVGRSITTYPLDSLLNAVVDTTDNLPVLTLNVSDMDCFETENGAIDLVVSGGQSPYSYVWSNGETTQDLSFIGSGTYGVTVTDAVGEVAEGSATVTHVPTHPEPVIGTLDGPISVNAWESYNYAVDVTSGSTFEWNIVGGVLNASAANTASILWQAGPSGVLTVTETDANGCTSTEGYTVNILFVGVDEGDESALLVYPIPNNGNFTLDLGRASDRTSLALIDVTGRTVWSGHMDGIRSKQINVDLPNGIYELVVMQDGDQSSCSIQIIQ